MSSRSSDERGARRPEPMLDDGAPASDRAATIFASSTELALEEDALELVA